MRADLLALIIIAVYFIGYKFYSKLFAEKIFKFDDNKKTPAHELNDGIDYVPTPKRILFGHHFASIAGAAPIVGPCIAVYWGWVPALIWVVLGNIVMGAVHDMGTLFLSVRHKAKSLANVTGSVINKKSKLLLLIVILFLIWIVSAAFAVIIARLFVTYPGSVLPINIAIVLALIIGYLFYVKKVPLLIPSITALVLLYASIPLGLKFPLDLTLYMSEAYAIAAWVAFLMVYGFIASVLPVWVLLQPRDYINSHQLIVGLGILIIGIIVTKPVIVAPEFNLNPGDGPPWFPFLFITIACGAISGAHGLIASGTTSKQINLESDIRPVGYGAMLVEGTLALLAIIAATAGFSDSSSWHSHYHSWEYASKHGLDAFVHGAANFLANLGIANELGAVFIAVIVISFAATTLDTVFRIQRFIIAEIGEMIDQPILDNRYLGSAIAVISVIALTFSNGIENLNGAFTLWPLFGASNQLLAALGLMIIGIYLLKEAKRSKTQNHYLLILIPALFLIVLTIISNLISIQSFYEQSNYLLCGISLILLVLELLIIFEGYKSLSTKKYIP